MEHETNDAVAVGVAATDENVIAPKKRGRKSKEEVAAAIVASAPVDSPDGALRVWETEEAIRLDEVDAVYGNGFEYDARRVTGEIGILVTDIQRSFIEIGKRLILLKEHEGHGGFLKALENLQFPERTAQRLMRCAVVATSLSPNPTTSSDLGQYKLLEIATLGDDEIKELGEGGSVAGLKLDDIERMSVREVREAFRTERQKRSEETAARERVIKEKNDKIDELERELRGLPPKTQNEVNAAVIGEQRKKLCGLVGSAVSLILEAQAILERIQRLPEVDVLQLNELETALKDNELAWIDDALESLSETINDLRPIQEAQDVPALG